MPMFAGFYRHKFYGTKLRIVWLSAEFKESLRCEILLNKVSHFRSIISTRGLCRRDAASSIMIRVHMFQTNLLAVYF